MMLPRVGARLQSVIPSSNPAFYSRLDRFGATETSSAHASPWLANHAKTLAVVLPGAGVNSTWTSCHPVTAVSALTWTPNRVP
jgi:hypothetical protein